mmetsp:Transcript_62353/g.136264  ORF Transcript_62353/g.136264 Transcript_62353/m.136264 type:complete len:472 (+) Transcript_62353:989-2404(+)
MAKTSSPAAEGLLPMSSVLRFFQEFCTFALLPQTFELVRIMLDLLQFDPHDDRPCCVRHHLRVDVTRSIRSLNRPVHLTDRKPIQENELKSHAFPRSSWGQQQGSTHERRHEGSFVLPEVLLPDYKGHGFSGAVWPKDNRVPFACEAKSCVLQRGVEEQFRHSEVSLYFAEVLGKCTIFRPFPNNTHQSPLIEALEGVHCQQLHLHPERPCQLCRGWIQAKLLGKSQDLQGLLSTSNFLHVLWQRPKGAGPFWTVWQGLLHAALDRCLDRSTKSFPGGLEVSELLELECLRSIHPSSEDPIANAVQHKSDGLNWLLYWGRLGHKVRPGLLPAMGRRLPRGPNLLPTSGLEGDMASDHWQGARARFQPFAPHPGREQWCIFVPVQLPHTSVLGDRDAILETLALQEASELLGLLLFSVAGFSALGNHLLQPLSGLLVVRLQLKAGFEVLLCLCKLSLAQSSHCSPIERLRVV